MFLGCSSWQLRGSSLRGQAGPTNLPQQGFSASSKATQLRPSAEVSPLVACSDCVSSGPAWLGALQLGPTQAPPAATHPPAALPAPWCSQLGGGGRAGSSGSGDGEALRRGGRPSGRRRKARHPGLFEVEDVSPPKRSLGIHALPPVSAAARLRLRLACCTVAGRVPGVGAHVPCLPALRSACPVPQHAPRHPHQTPPRQHQPPPPCRTPTTGIRLRWRGPATWCSRWCCSSSWCAASTGKYRQGLCAGLCVAEVQAGAVHGCMATAVWQAWVRAMAHG